MNEEERRGVAINLVRFLAVFYAEILQMLHMAENGDETALLQVGRRGRKEHGEGEEQAEGQEWQGHGCRVGLEKQSRPKAKGRIDVNKVARNWVKVKEALFKRQSRQGRMNQSEGEDKR